MYAERGCKLNANGKNEMLRMGWLEEERIEEKI